MQAASGLQHQGRSSSLRALAHDTVKARYAREMPAPALLNDCSLLLLFLVRYGYGWEELFKLGAVALDR
jgi:hypothetical protein